MTPAWRRLFDTWEKAVAPGLEDLTASPEFRDLVAVLARVDGASRRRVEEVSRRWLHAWNLPAGTDIRKLRRQISDLEREVAGLRRALQAATDDDRADRLAALAAIDGDEESTDRTGRAGRARN